MREPPLVSVVTPNYNHGHYLESLCAGIAEQGNHTVEHVIVDDRSTDNSIEIIKRLQRKHSFLKLIRQPRQIGVVAAMNRGLSEVRGKYVVFRSADDIDEPEFHKTALELLERNPQVGLFCGDVRFLSGSEEHSIVEPLGFSDAPKAFPKSEYPFLLGKRWLNGHTVMVRSDLLKACTPFLHQTAHISDWFHFMIAGFRGGFCYAPQTVVAARVSSNSYSSQKELDDQPAKTALAAMLDGLVGPYNDTLEAFVKSGALLRFGEPIEVVIRSHPSYQQFLPLAEQIRDIRLGKVNRESSLGLERAIRDSIENRITRLVELAKNHSIWIYGGGGHTHAMLSQWNHFPLPTAKGILSSTTPDSSSIYNLPAFSLETAPLSEGDIVIISSKSYEGYMANRIHEMGNLRCFAIWNRSLDRLH